LGIAIPSTPFTTHASQPGASRAFGVESRRFYTEGDQTFTVLGRWAFLTINIDPSHFNPATGTPDSGAHIAFQNDYGSVIE
jgi:hypothetical protein